MILANRVTFDKRTFSSLVTAPQRVTAVKGVDESNCPTRCAGAITLIKLPAFMPTRQYGCTPMERRYGLGYI